MLQDATTPLAVPERRRAAGGGPHAYVITGPPTAGKTSAMRYVVERMPATAHFKVRGFMRELIDEGHPVGTAVRGAYDREEVFGDATMRQAVTLFLERNKRESEVLAFEGYPRSVAQLRDLGGCCLAAGVTLGPLIVVDIPSRVVLQRASMRRVCTACGLPEQVFEDAPPADHERGGAGRSEECEACGGAVRRRADDAVDRVSGRLATFRAFLAELETQEVRRPTYLSGLVRPERIAASICATLDATLGGAGRDRAGRDGAGRDRVGRDG